MRHFELAQVKASARPERAACGEWFIAKRRNPEAFSASGPRTSHNSHCRFARYGVALPGRSTLRAIKRVWPEWISLGMVTSTSRGKAGWLL